MEGRACASGARKRSSAGALYDACADVGRGHGTSNLTCHNVRDALETEVRASGFSSRLRTVVGTRTVRYTAMRRAEQALRATVKCDSHKKKRVTAVCGTRCYVIKCFVFYARGAFYLSRCAYMFREAMHQR